jgi:glucose/arabinose dehydrogenase
MNRNEENMHKWIIYLFMAALLLLPACQPITPSTPTEMTQEVMQETATEEAMDAPVIVETVETPDTAEEPHKLFEPIVSLRLLAEGLTAPVALTAPDDGSGRLFVVDQVGLIRVIDAEGNLLDMPFLDVRELMVNLGANYDERGLLGMAFHPDYADNGRFFVYYSAPLRAEAPQGWNHTSVLAEFSVSEADGNIAALDSEKVILQVDQPQANHNAGSIVFGPDGYLYIPLGDGGGANDSSTGHMEDWYAANAGGNGQDVEQNMLGSVLRIDIDNGDPYAVPADNLEVSETFPEIWAYGFRNPYRMAFDPGGNHELFLGDAGQELWEEVSILTAGGNYGWNVKEGTHCFSTANPGSLDAVTDCPAQNPDGDPLIDPIIEFPNTKHPEGGLGATVVGGVVYRGEDLPAWDGKYLFGQWSLNFSSPQGGLFVATRPSDEGQRLWAFEEIQITNREGGGLGEFLLALGQDIHGEVYVLTSLNTGPSGNTGKVYRITAP